MRRRPRPERCSHARASVNYVDGVSGGFWSWFLRAARMPPIATPMPAPIAMPTPMFPMAAPNTMPMATPIAIPTPVFMIESPRIRQPRRHYTAAGLVAADATQHPTERLLIEQRVVGRVHAQQHQIE